VKPNKRDDFIERRQMELIQRIGRIGYWEYDPGEKSISLEEPSLDLLASIVGRSPNAGRPFMDALCDVERNRLQNALDRAVAKRLTLNIELKLASDDGKPSFIVVRGAPLDVDQGSLPFAGTFQDITNE
jgi:hypothetical protein